MTMTPRDLIILKRIPYYDRRILLGCHNFWVTEKVAIDLYDNSGSVAELERYLKLHCQKTPKIDDLINTLYMIEVFKDADIRYLQDLLFLSG
jgi:hypothetical protein